jgi:Carboxypeptidase regulatory-like domain/TonB-dependent Receptor Plug Domain
MKFRRSALARVFSAFVLMAWTITVPAQTGSAGALRGVVTDPSGAVISGAAVHLSNKASGFDRTTTTDASGQYTFSNVPFNPYRIEVTATGFAPITQNTEVNSAVGTTLNLVMQIAAGTQTVTVESEGPLVEDTSTYHTDVDRDLFNKVPLESVSSGLSSLVTETTPGVSADSNGLFHGLGDHASNSFSIDGQPITDQQSKVFSNQLPTNAVQSLEVIEGAPPAQYGDKTSLVIVATTRSGQGITTPTGSVYGSYGTFGTATAGYDLSYGGQNWGNFIEMDGLNTGRFLDPPEFTVIHAKGNELNFFDRIDYSFTSADSIHLNLNFSRSWFQTPNAFDNLNVCNVIDGTGANANPQNLTACSATNSTGPVFGNVGNTDQRSQIKTFNVAPTYTRIISQNSVLNFNVYTRRDEYNYFPSNNPLADLGPANLQTSSISQYRTLMNTGGHADYTWVRGHHNLLAGAEYNSTFLREHNALGIVSPTDNSPCVNAVTGVSLPGYANPAQCNGLTNIANANFAPVLAPYDLTRGGNYYFWFGHADIKELSMYIEDQIKLGRWNLNLGIRGDKYNGLAAASQAEPRLGVAYNVKPTGTVLSVSYARTLETPFNENLVLSSLGCADAVLAPLLSCTPGVTGILQPGFRNEFHTSVQQAFGKNLVFSGEYIWKYTHNAFDFSVLGNTPITFPIDWHNSKIPGYALHLQVPGIHNFSAYLDASSVAARFFPPQVAGAGATVGHVGLPFRIDHDERYNQTAHVQYTLPSGKDFNRFAGGIWGGFNWRYDSGQVAGSTPCFGVTDPNTPCTNSSTLLNGQPAIAMVDNTIPAGTNPVTGAPTTIPLTADQEFQAGLECNGQKATPFLSQPAVCPANQLTSSLLRIPAPDTGDNDHNPPRIAPRNLFDVDLGKNNVFHADKYKLDLDLTAVNVTNKYALYNFLSTFSGTHYVTPRALTAKATLNF